MVESTWFERDLPVLRAVVELDEESVTGYIEEQAIAARTGLDIATVRRSLKALAHNDPPFGKIELASMAGDWWVQTVTGHARREVGQWPNPKTDAGEQIAAILAAFDQAEEKAPDEDSKSKLRALAASFKGLPVQVAEGVSTALLLKLSGLG